MSLRRSLKAVSLRAFRGLDRAGLHVLPKHYYTPVADRAWLRANPALWRRPASLAGVDWDLDRQHEWLRGVCGKHYGEVAGLGTYEEFDVGGFGPGYGPIESQVLHCFVRSEGPARILEVGGGVTTATMNRASRLNERDLRPRSRITTIEPFPSEPLLRLDVEVVRSPCQAVPLWRFCELEAGDLLLIDSSHAVKTGSEVLFLYLEVFPRLATGVVVHVHDVFLPYLYSPLVLEEYFDPQETSLLLALLQGNGSLEVLCCESALHHDRPDELMAILPDYRPLPLREGIQAPSAEGHFPAALFLRRR